MAQIFRPSLAQTIGVFPEENPLARDVVGGLQKSAQTERQIEAMIAVLDARNPVFRTMRSEEMKRQIAGSAVRGGPQFIDALLQPGAFGDFQTGESGQPGQPGDLSQIRGFQQPPSIGNVIQTNPDKLKALMLEGERRRALRSSDASAIPQAEESVAGTGAFGLGAGIRRSVSEAIPPALEFVTETVPSAVSSAIQSTAVGAENLLESTAVGAENFARGLAGSTPVDTKPPIPSQTEKLQGRFLSKKLKSLKKALKRSGSDLDLSNKAISDNAKELGVSRIEIISRLIRRGQEKGLIK